MPVIKNVEIWYPKLAPENPSFAFRKEGGRWEVQIRTKNKKQKEEWQGLGLNVIPVIYKQTDIIDHYKVTLHTNATDKSGKPMRAPAVVDGEMMPLDPNILGNGSIVNIQFTQREFNYNGKKGMGSHITGVQVIKLVEYKRGNRLEFENVGATEVVGNGQQDDDDDSDD